MDIRQVHGIADPPICLCMVTSASETWVLCCYWKKGLQAAQHPAVLQCKITSCCFLAPPRHFGSEVCSFSDVLVQVC